MNLQNPTSAVTAIGYAGASTAGMFGTNTGLEVDLSLLNASGDVGTINDLRLAFQIQALTEVDARGGSRYVEQLWSHFGVVSPDFRLQRPEYLGGGQIRIVSHPVAQTAPTSGSNPQAQLASFATASGSRIGCTKSFVEHGYLIGLMCARADITYPTDRDWETIRI